MAKVGLNLAQDSIGRMRQLRFPIGPQVSISNFSFLRMAASMFVCLEADQAALKFRLVCRGGSTSFLARVAQISNIQLGTSPFASLSCTKPTCLVVIGVDPDIVLLLDRRTLVPVTAVHQLLASNCSVCSPDPLAPQLLRLCLGCD